MNISLGWWNQGMWDGWDMQHIWERINVYKFAIRKLEGKKVLWNVEYNIKTDLKKYSPRLTGFIRLRIGASGKCGKLKHNESSTSTTGARDGVISWPAERRIGRHLKPCGFGGQGRVTDLSLRTPAQSGPKLIHFSEWCAFWGPSYVVIALRKNAGSSPG